jgi:hypothetical protein
MGFESYLIENVNQIHSLTVQAKVHPDRQSEKLLEATAIGCETLKRLVEDRSFSRTVEELSSARSYRVGSGADQFRQHDTDEFRKLVEREESFEEFLRIEYDILVKSGLFADIAAELIQESRGALKSVRERARPASEVVDAARRLRDQACQISDELIKQAQEDRTWERFKDRIKKIIKGIGGLAVIGVNAAAFISTAATPAAPATLAMGAVSGAIGGEILKNAVAPLVMAAGPHGGIGEP